MFYFALSAPFKTEMKEIFNPGNFLIISLKSVSLYFSLSFWNSFCIFICYYFLPFYVYFYVSPHPYIFWGVVFKFIEIQSYQFILSVMCSSLRPHGLQHTRLRCPSSYCFIFLAALCSLKDLSCLIRDPTHAPCRGSVEF